MHQGIIHADKTYRRKVLVICIVLLSLVGLLIGWVLPWAKEYLDRLDPEMAFWGSKRSGFSRRTWREQSGIFGTKNADIDSER